MSEQQRLFSNHYLQQLYEKHLAKFLEQASKEEPIDPATDSTNPHIQFWALIHMGDELDRELTSNSSYYASGRCGGCETCGEPPFPGVPYDAGSKFKTAMTQVLERMREFDARMAEELNTTPNSQEEPLQD